MKAGKHSTSQQSGHNVSQQSTHFVSTNSSETVHLGCLSHLSSSPAYSMAGSRMMSRDVNNVPGPGYYGVVRPEVTMRTGGSACILEAKTGRFSPVVPTDDPGPGSYRVAAAAPGPAFTIAGRHELQSSIVSPGPAAYSEVRKDGRPEGFSFPKSGRSDAKAPKASPGPAHYNVDAAGVLQRAPAFGMGSGTRGPAEVFSGPGPGEYELPAPKMNSFTVPTRNAASFGRDETPGPGSYELPAPARSRNFGTMSRAVARTHNDDVPGPGGYNIARDLGRIPGGRFGRAPKMGKDMLAIGGPAGPGQYTVDRQKLRAVSMPKAERQPLEGRPEGPGPGQYDVHAKKFVDLGTTRREGPSHCFSQVERFKEPLSARGAPSASPPQPAKSRTPRADPGTERAGPVSPGVVSADRTDPAWSFGNAPRPSLAPVSNVPGPGTYSTQDRDRLGALQPTLKTRRGIERHSLAASILQSTPGPGHYGAITSMGPPPRAQRSRPSPRRKVPEAEKGEFSPRGSMAA